MSPSRAKLLSLAHVGLALAALYVLFVLVASTNASGLGIALLGSGVAVALYGSALFMARGTGPRVVFGSAVIAVAGLSHIAWVLAFGAAVRTLAASLRVTFLSEIGAMFLATGIAFALVIGACTRSWPPVLINAVAATASVSCSLIEPSMGNLALGAGSAVLHVGIALSIYLDTVRELRHRPRPGACVHCGYDLAGLPDSPHEKCPECGHRRLESRVSD